MTAMITVIFRRTYIPVYYLIFRVPEKERVAGEILSHNPEIKGSAQYPDCTDVWIALPEDKKLYVYKHCLFKHGYLDKIEFDGKPYLFKTL